MNYWDKITKTVQSNIPIPQEVQNELKAKDRIIYNMDAELKALKDQNQLLIKAYQDLETQKNAINSDLEAQAQLYSRAVVDVPTEVLESIMREISNMLSDHIGEQISPSQSIMDLPPVVCLTTYQQHLSAVFNKLTSSNISTADLNQESQNELESLKVSFSALQKSYLQLEQKLHAQEANKEQLIEQLNSAINRKDFQIRNFTELLEKQRISNDLLKQSLETSYNQLKQKQQQLQPLRHTALTEREEFDRTVKIMLHDLKTLEESKNILEAQLNQIRQTKGQKQTIKNTFDSLKSQYDHLKSQFNQKQKQNSNLISQIDKLQKQIQNLNSFKQSNDNLNNQINSLNRQIDSFRQQNSYLIAQNDSLKILCDKLRGEKDSLSQKMSENEASLKLMMSIETEKKILLEKLQFQTSIISDLQNKLKEQAATIQQLNKPAIEIETVQDESTCHGETPSKSNISQNLSEQTVQKKYTTQQSQLRSQFVKLQELNRNHLEQIGQLKAQINRMNRVNTIQIQTQTSVIPSTQKQFKNVQSVSLKVIPWVAERQKIKNESISEIEVQYQRLKEQLEEQVSRNSAFHIKIADLQKQLFEKVNSLNQANQKLSEANKVICTEGEKIKAMSAQISEKQAQIKEMQALNDTSKQLNTLAELKINSYVKEVNGMTKQLSILSEANKALSVDIEDFKVQIQRLKQFERVSEETQKTLQKVSTELNIVRKDKEQTLNDSKLLQAMIQDYQSQCSDADSLRQNMNKMQAAVEAFLRLNSFDKFDEEAIIRQHQEQVGQTQKLQTIHAQAMAQKSKEIQDMKAQFLRKYTLMEQKVIAVQKSKTQIMEELQVNIATRQGHEERLSDLLVDHQSKTQLLKEIKNKYEGKEKECLRLIQELNEAKLQANQLRMQLAESNRMLTEASKQLGEALKACSSLKDSEGLLRNEIQKLKEGSKQAQLKIEHYNSQTLIMQKQMEKNIVESASQKEIDRKSLQQVTREKDSALQHLKEESKGRLEQRTQHKKELQQLRDNAEKSSFQSKSLIESQQKTEQLQLKLQQKEQQVKKLSASLQSMRSTISQLEEGIETYQTYADQKGRDLDQYKSKYTVLEESHNELKARFTCVEEQLNMQDKILAARREELSHAGSNASETSKTNRIQNLQPIKRVFLQYFSVESSYEHRLQALKTLEQVLSLTEKEQQQLAYFRKAKIVDLSLNKQTNKPAGIQQKLFSYLTSEN